MKQKTKNQEDKYEMIYPVGISIMIVFILGIVILFLMLSNNSGYQDGINETLHNQSFISQIQNETLNNATLILPIANQINIQYVNKYNAIPIYQDGIKGTEVWQCNNFSRIK